MTVSRETPITGSTRAVPALLALAACGGKAAGDGGGGNGDGGGATPATAISSNQQGASRLHRVFWNDPDDNNDENVKYMSARTYVDVIPQDVDAAGRDDRTVVIRRDGEYARRTVEDIGSAGRCRTIFCRERVPVTGARMPLDAVESSSMRPEPANRQRNFPPKWPVERAHITRGRTKNEPCSRCPSDGPRGMHRASSSVPVRRSRSDRAPRSSP